MGSKYRRVKCPRCSKIGVFRPKDKRLNKLYIYHYDPIKYKRTGNGDRWHYLGDYHKQNQRFLVKLLYENIDDPINTKINFSRIREILPSDEGGKLEFLGQMDNLRKKTKGLESNNISLDLELFAAFINELRKIRLGLERQTKMRYEESTWSNIKCPTVR
ncbi:MAG: hypothetical protein HRU07_09530 [Nitrosopumilus sp.]|nr:hypothetical protein [Nitrosopumilus sp.]NRA06367.1 hypothetical protein [Nitrosopumilus sp.]